MPQTPDQEPSIEEILASIRQIISDDDEEPAGGASDEPEEPVSAPMAVEPPPPPKAAPAAQPKPAPVPDPVSVSEPEDDILELKDPLPPAEIVLDTPPEPPARKAYDIEMPKEEPSRDSMIDLSETPPEKTRDEPQPSVLNPADEPSILSNMTANAALTGFSRLAGNIAIDRRRNVAEGVTLEDIVRDMLQPMLREWMDQNLPGMIERLVEKELEKLSRKAMDD